MAAVLVVELEGEAALLRARARDTARLGALMRCFADAARLLRLALLLSARSRALPQLSAAPTTPSTGGRAT